MPILRKVLPVFAALVWLFILLMAVALLLPPPCPAEGAALQGGRGGCAQASRYDAVACTVDQAGPGWAFGGCETENMFFMGQTKLKLAEGDLVSVTGCKDQTGTLYSAKDFPLRIKRRK